MTTIDRQVTRRCPEITNGEGRPLEIRLSDLNGGSIHLKWVGLRRGSEHTVDILEMMNCIELPEAGACSQEQVKGDNLLLKADEDVTAPDLISIIRITPMELADKERLLKIMKEIQLRQEWLADPGEASFEVWKEKIDNGAENG